MCGPPVGEAALIRILIASSMAVHRKSSKILQLLNTTALWKLGVSNQNEQVAFMWAVALSIRESNKSATFLEDLWECGSFSARSLFETDKTRRQNWDALVQWASESSVFLVQLITLLVLWQVGKNWKNKRVISLVQKNVQRNCVEVS